MATREIFRKYAVLTKGRPYGRVRARHVDRVVSGEMVDSSTGDRTSFTSSRPNLFQNKPPKLNRGSLEVFSSTCGQYIPVPGRWLRDNFSASDSINQDTQQRQINVLKGTLDCKIRDLSLDEESQTFKVTFNDGYQTSVTSRTLQRKGDKTTEIERAGIIPTKLWDNGVATHPPAVNFDSVQNSGVGQLLKHIRTHGFCFVEDTPINPKDTERLLERIGPIRNTHYGGFYDFTADLSAKDTAYTNESLEPHTDNTYFTDPAGLQALHLISHTDGSGGESILVDGFAVAEKLRRLDRGAFQTLCRVPVFAHASGNDGISIQPCRPFPVLSCHPHLRTMMQIRWNNADRAGIACDFNEMDRWYDAASLFNGLVSDHSSQYKFQLKPGRLLIFDNWRVLHGRTAFTGKRRICGGYINYDDFISKFKTTNMKPEDVRATTVTG